MSQFPKLEKQEVIGTLKATGSRDKDILYAAKMGLLKVPNFAKSNGTMCMVAGGLMTITIIMAIVGIPFLIFGWWMRRRAVSNIKTVEAVYAEYIAGL